MALIQKNGKTDRRIKKDIIKDVFGDESTEVKRDKNIISLRGKTQRDTDQMFKEINPAKDILDKALMNKYPKLDLDNLKKGAESINNPDLIQYIQKNSPEDQYLTKDEMRAALGEEGYNRYIENTNMAHKMFELDNTGDIEMMTKDGARMYGKRSSLFKYENPRVNGKLKPYRYSNELMGLMSGGKTKEYKDGGIASLIKNKNNKMLNYSKFDEYKNVDETTQFLGKSKK